VERGRKFLLVQHMDWEGPGEHLLAGLAEFGAGFRLLEAWHEPLPDLEPYRGLIVLGGAPNVGEEEQFPYLRPLKGAIREVIARGKAYLGFCLGHQLLGHVLGCKVGPLPQKSVGYIAGELSARGLAHPAFQGWPRYLDLFKWHGQGVLLPTPEEVEILAYSPAVAVEALGLAGNPKVVGLQFDNHAGSGDVRRWLEHDGDWALRGSGADPGAILETAAAKDKIIGPLFRQFLKNFLQLV